MNQWHKDLHQIGDPEQMHLGPEVLPLYYTHANEIVDELDIIQHGLYAWLGCSSHASVRNQFFRAHLMRISVCIK